MAALPFVVVGLGAVAAFGLAMHATSQNIEALCAHRASIPSVTTVQLEEKGYQITFREEREGRVKSIEPPVMTLEISPPEGAPKPDQILEKETLTSSIGSVNIRSIGHVEVAKAGRYTVRITSPETRGAVCIGNPAITGANNFMRSVGVFVVAVLFAVSLGRRGRKREDAAA